MNKENNFPSLGAHIDRKLKIKLTTLQHEHGILWREKEKFSSKERAATISRAESNLRM
jgi:hypothetical protein